MKSVALVLCAILLGCSFVALVNAHAACFAVKYSNFTNDSQRCDCDYHLPPASSQTDNETQHQIDLFWINFTHTYAVQGMSKQPFGAALVDSRNNSLVGVGFNSFYTGDDLFSAIITSHAETALMTNLSITTMKGTWDPSTLTRRVDPNWRFMTLYGNIEACPMCAQGAIWRGIKRFVFGARASELKRQRCWNQPTLTMYEVADHNQWANIQVVRGPIYELEDKIVQDFPNFCQPSYVAPPEPSLPNPIDNPCDVTTPSSAPTTPPVPTTSPTSTPRPSATPTSSVRTNASSSARSLLASVFSFVVFTIVALL